MESSINIGEILPIPSKIYDCSFAINDAQILINTYKVPTFLLDSSNSSAHTPNPKVKELIKFAEEGDKVRPEIIKFEIFFQETENGKDIYENQETKLREELWLQAEQLFHNENKDIGKKSEEPKKQEAVMDKLKLLNYIEAKGKSALSSNLVVKEYILQNSSKKIDHQSSEDNTAITIQEMTYSSNILKVDKQNTLENMPFYQHFINYPISETDTALFLVGGITNNLAVEYCYSYMNSTLKQISNLFEARAFAGVALCKGFIAVVGGEIGINLVPPIKVDSIELLDVRNMAEPKWTLLKYRLHIPRSHCSACFCLNKLYIIGGKASPFSNADIAYLDYIDTIEVITYKGLEAEGTHIKVSNLEYIGCNGGLCSLINESTILVLGGTACVHISEKLREKEEEAKKITKIYNDLLSTYYHQNSLINYNSDSKAIVFNEQMPSSLKAKYTLPKHINKEFIETGQNMVSIDIKQLVSSPQNSVTYLPFKEGSEILAQPWSEWCSYMPVYAINGKTDLLMHSSYQPEPNFSLNNYTNVKKEPAIALCSKDPLKLDIIHSKALSE